MDGKHIVFNNQPFVLELQLWNSVVTDYKSLAAMHDLLCKYSYTAVVWTSSGKAIHHFVI